MSFPPANEMFQFAGFASTTYGFNGRYRFRGGLPHSEIRGSMGARPSPRLIAACYVLLRLSVPRHPPNALTSRLIRRNRRTQEKSPASAGLATQLSSRSGHGIEASECASRNPRPRVSRGQPQPIHNDQQHRPGLSPNRLDFRCFLCPRHSPLARPLRRALRPKPARTQTGLVELNGIEPMTSCLQSRRSPN